MKRFAKIALALFVVAAALEAALHLFPVLLPRSYLAHFPANGCEFFHPGILARTPVEGVLLPHLANAYHGAPPADLCAMGIAPRSLAPGQDQDARTFPEIDLPADALGFPNPAVLERADLVLLGDSFGVAAGVRTPEALQGALEHATRLSIANLSLAGIGPVQERWLLETVALAKHPRAVLWFYFSGNDLTASYEPLVARHAGKTTWAEAWPERAKPRFFLPDLIASALRATPPPLVREPLPGFAFHAADGSTRSLWFDPDQLLQLSWTRATWEAHPVWAPVQNELRAARDACRTANVGFALVYLPSKPEVYLPVVARDPELARRTVVALGVPAPPISPDEHYDALIANRHAQEELLRDFCARESIPFLSATPALEALAERGELGYLVTDTHWQALGQAALLEPLLDFLRRAGFLD